MTLRTGALAVLAGLLLGSLLFILSELQAGRVDALFAALLGRPVPAVDLTPVVPKPPIALVVPTATPTTPPTPTRAPPTPTVAPTRAPGSPPAGSGSGGAPQGTPRPTTTPRPELTATPRPEPTATRPPPPTPTPSQPREVGLTAADLSRELAQAVESGGMPLRNPVLRLMSPDRVVVNGHVPVAFLQIPVEIEARIFATEDGSVVVQTLRIQAVGASLPAAVESNLRQRVDQDGTAAVQAALPPGERAREVVVEPERIRVFLMD